MNTNIFAEPSSKLIDNTLYPNKLEEKNSQVTNNPEIIWDFPTVFKNIPDVLYIVFIKHEFHFSYSLLIIISIVLILFLLN